MGLWDKLHLDMDRDRVVTLTGGGGKTTTMYAMAREAAAFYGWCEVNCVCGGEIRPAEEIAEEIYRHVLHCMEG